jgi:signal transduction histidine kinase
MIVGLLLLLFLPALALADETVAPKTVLVLYDETRALAAVAETDDAIRSTIIAAVVLIVTQSALITMLLVQRARRQRLEDQARARREELAHAQRVAALGELSASLAHEITQPLTAIAANAQAARRMLATPAAGDELKEALGDIAGDAERAGSIVRRVRAMVRKQPGERQPIDINATVTGVTTILRRDIAQADISLQLRLAEDLPRVLGDGVQLQQVVLNLLVNACQAMADVVDGPVCCASRRRSRSPGASRSALPIPAPAWPDRSSSACSSPSSRARPKGSAWGCPSTVPSLRRTADTSWRCETVTAV